MGSALILGEPGTGLTTFVGLLYTAQVRYGTEDSDEFRFHADRESIRSLMGIYGALGDGRFPEGDVDLGSAPLTFVFGFRRGGLRRGSPGPGLAGPGFSTVRLIVGGVAPHDMAYLRDHDAVLDEPMRRLLRSPILLLLIDASYLTSDLKTIAGLPMVRYDAALAGTLDLLGKFLEADLDRKRRRMFPILVVTKFDRVRPEALDILGAPPAPPSTWGKDIRARVGERLLKNYLPETARYLTQPKHGKLEVEPPAWFFSGLRVQEDASGELRILRRERPPLGGWEPEYPFEEYRALIDLLRRLSQNLPRDPDEDAEYY